MKIDTHQHYWNIDKGYYKWISPDDHILYRDYEPKDLKPVLKSEEIDQTILIQAAPVVNETLELLSLAKAEKTIMGVIGWADIYSSDFIHQIDDFCKNEKFLGVRIMVQDMHNPEDILSNRAINSFRYLVKNKIPIEFLVNEKQLPLIINVLEKIPTLKGVINHLGKPDIKNNSAQFWNRNLKMISSFSSMFCKISGLVTEADENWTIKDFEYYIKTAYELFGENRTMFGSDWPVCLSRADYHQVIKIIENNIGNFLTTDQKDKLYGLNALDFYKPKHK